MSIKMTLSRRLEPVITGGSAIRHTSGMFDFPLLLKRAKKSGVLIQDILEGIQPGLSFQLGIESGTGFFDFIKQAGGHMLIRLMAEQFYSPGTFEHIHCDDNGVLMVRNAWSNTWDVRDITLTGSPAIDQIVWPSSDENQVAIQNLSAANACYIGWNAGSSVGYLELQPKQILQIPFARAAMYGHGTAGQHIITQRGGF